MKTTASSLGDDDDKREENVDLFPVVTKQVRAACRYSSTADGRDANNRNENQLLISRVKRGRTRLLGREVFSSQKNFETLRRESVEAFARLDV